MVEKNWTNSWRKWEAVTLAILKDTATTNRTVLYRLLVQPPL